MRAEIPAPSREVLPYFRTWRCLGELYEFNETVFLWTVYASASSSRLETALVRQVKSAVYLPEQLKRALEHPMLVVGAGSDPEVTEGLLPIAEIRARVAELAALPFDLRAAVSEAEISEIPFDFSHDGRFLEGIGFELRRGLQRLSLVWCSETGGPNPHVRDWILELQSHLALACGTERIAAEVWLNG